MNNNITSVALLEPPCPPALAPAAPLTGLSPQPSSPKGSGSKAQPCPHCHREFTNLRHHINQQHMQVMSRDYLLRFKNNVFLLQVKNFKCTECGYSCYLKTDLERHINNVHDKHRSPCPICGKKYSDLRQHVRIVHEGAKVRRYCISG